MRIKRRDLDKRRKSGIIQPSKMKKTPGIITKKKLAEIKSSEPNVIPNKKPFDIKSYQSGIIIKNKLSEIKSYEQAPKPVSKIESQDITLILTGYRRPDNLKQLMKALNAQTVKPVETMLWYNDGGPNYKQITLPNVKTAFCNFNFKFTGRFAYALLARTKYICIFDDDVIPGKRWLENCLLTMNKYHGIIVERGIRVHDAYKYYKPYVFGSGGVYTPNVVEVDLGGWSWFMERDWLRYFWLEEPLSWDNGEDIHLSYTCQKYGNISTYCASHPPNNLDVWGDINKGKKGQDDVASWRIPSHYEIRDECVRKASERGWRITNKKYQED